MKHSENLDHVFRTSSNILLTLIVDQNCVSSIYYKSQSRLKYSALADKSLRNIYHPSNLLKILQMGYTDLNDIWLFAQFFHKLSGVSPL